MTPELLPKYFPRGNPHLFKAQHIGAADAIVCVSRTTRDDLLTMFPGAEDRTFVAPLATGGVFAADIVRPSPLRVPFPYVIFVGGRGSYKSFDTLMGALSIVRQGGGDIGVVLVGGGAVSSEEARSMAHAGIPESRWKHCVPSDEELSELYRGSLLLSYPSLYEGFGMPVLDAMSSGTLVVTSDAPALLEVGAGFAAIHKRGDHAELAEVIFSLMGLSDCERLARIRAGREHSRSFSWARTALLTADAYSAAGG